MDTDPPRISPSIDQEIAVRRAIQHNESAIAVVDVEGHFIGFVPPQRLLAILLWEHEEDMSVSADLYGTRRQHGAPV